MWRRGEHCDWNKDFEPKDNEDLAIEYLKLLGNVQVSYLYNHENKRSKKKSTENYANIIWWRKTT